MPVTHSHQTLTVIHSARPPALTSSKTAEEQPPAEPCARMVNEAASRIYSAWQPHVGHAAALREARAFAGRFHILIDGPLAPLPDYAELDPTLEAVAAAMTILDGAAATLDA